MREPDQPTTITPPTSVECGRPRLDSAERWRSLLDDKDEARLFCLGCAESEGFGDS